MININKFFYYLVCILFLFAPFQSYSTSNDAPNLNINIKKKLSWDQWLDQIKIKFREKKINDKTINLLNFVKFNSRVIELDRQQPEFTITFEKYFNNVVNVKSKKNLNRKYLNNIKLLSKINDQFNVNPKILVALWGIETSFGNHIGKLDILRSLASLAYDGRRRDFFTKELENALIILDQGHFDRKSFKGSWAGAFGQTQFMPSTFLKYAVDFDGDSKKNLFRKHDALASGANYLKSVGWNNDLPWGQKVNISLTDRIRVLEKKKIFKTFNFWNEMGANLNNKFKNVKLRIVVPDSKYNECYLVSENFDVILNWNRSNYFALTVFLFSDEIN